MDEGSTLVCAWEDEEAEGSKGRGWMQQPGI